MRLASSSLPEMTRDALPDERPTAGVMRLRRLAWLLDDAFRIPGTGIRFGWDPIIGLVPWVGDVLTGLMSMAIVFHAFRVRIPGVIKFRMLTNILIDVLVGSIPVLGDMFDVTWKANRKNMALLEKHALTGAPPGPGDWLFVAAAGFVFALAIAVPILALWLLFGAIPRWLHGPNWRGL
jgi:hypothetical protein